MTLLVSRYRNHEAFTDLAVRTRSDYQRVFDYLQPIGDTPLTWFTPPRIVRIRDKAGQDKGRRFGTYVKTVLSIVFGWGVERGYVCSNPTFKIKSIRKPKDAPQANRPWTDAERAVVLAEAPPQVLLPIGLMMFTGMDPQDALTFPRAAMTEGSLEIRRGKTGVSVPMLVVSQLQSILDSVPLPDIGPICLNGRGHMWTIGGFNSSWRKLKSKLEKADKIGPGLTLKGLRHTVGTILGELEGVGPEDINAMLGHKTVQMAEHYSRRADRRKRVAGTVDKSEAEVNRRGTKVSTPFTKSVKP